MSNKIEKGLFAAGCFWGIEAAFSTLDGVLSTKVGYCGGNVDNPTYEDVCKGNTGHAEAVEVTFDKNKIDYSTLLDLFWEIHDPTQLNRQGPDIGRQYRTAIFPLNADQGKLAKEAINLLNNRLPIKIATSIESNVKFWAAEHYHQHYFKKMGRHGYRLPKGFKSKS